MRSIPISEFKATCLAVLERVRQTGQPVLITKHGQPVAEVIPPRPAKHEGKNFVGRLKGTFEIVGDITKPIISAEQWEKSRLEEWDELNK